MEPILTLDLADSPAKLRVITYEQDKPKVISESSVELIFQSEAPTTEQVGENANASNSSISQQDPDTFFVSQLSSAVEKIESPWTQSAILLAPKSYHSMNLELPFKDDKNVAKVLALEAQDRLPFEINEFFLEHRILSQRPDSQYDVHVALTRKTELENILNNCQKAGIDPLAVSTVSSALVGQIVSNPDTFSTNSILLAFHGDYAYLTFRVAGEIRSDRSIKYSGLDSSDFISEIRRTIYAVESRYSVKFEELSVDSSEMQLSAKLDGTNQSRSIESILKDQLKINVKSIADSSSGIENRLAEWFAVLCSEGKTSNLLVNFRTGQFSQTLRWGALWNITKTALPYFLMLFFVAAVILIATYVTREREITSLQDALIAKVKPLINTSPLAPGQVVKAIQTTNDTIEKQLKDLGSPSKFSPLDVLTEVTKDFSSIRDVTISAVNIRGTQLLVTGSSSNYENVDAIERVLQSKRTLYCRHSKQVSGTSSRQFTFTVVLCD